MTAKRMRLLTAGLAIIALIAALFVINPGLGRSAAAAWDGTAAESFEGGNGDSSDPYIIKTAYQLAFLAKQVNGGETYHGKYFQLEADLDLSGSEWSPIGIGERETDGSTVTKPFAGTFDGKNHKISGLTLTAGLDDQGLFGCSSGTIGNLGIVRGNISVGSAERIGAICGYSTGTIENCWNSADITGSTEGGKYVGGICGYSTGTIYGCLNMGDITANSFIGGICGNTAQSTQISNCFNSGSITGKEQIGGIAGINLNYITFCINAGELTGEESVYAVSHSDDVRNIYASISYSFYNSDVFSPSSGDKEVTGIPTGALCGSILNKYNFYKNLWESGSITLDGSGKAQMTYVRLKNIPAAPAAMEREVFNFGTESDPDWDTYTLITEAQQFVDIGADKAKWNQNYVLGNDIDLESRTDVKIIENYYGKFSGNGHSIKNVYINEPEKSQVALFGEVNSGSVIRDLTLDGGSIYGKESVAGIAVVNNGSLINCTNSCSVSGDIGDIGFIGGVCAYSEGTLISCRNTGSVSCTAGTHDEGRTTGGVCGYSYGKISGCYNSGTVESPKQAGGVCGSSSDGEIKNCYNSGAVSGTKNVGGICGTGNSNSLSGCFNSGEVTGTGNIGGICGSVSGYESNGHEIVSSVSGCANTGKESAGGVCGKNSGTVQMSYNTGAVTGTLKTGGVCGESADRSTLANCYNTGMLVGDSVVGGICGSVESSADVSSSFSMAEICGNSEIGGNIGTGPSKNCFYSKDLFLKEDFGGPVETKDLTSRLSGFSGDIWERGSYTKGTENGRYRSDNYTLISLKGVGKAQSGELRMYNYFTVSGDSWRYYNPITTADEFQKLTQNSAMWRRNYVLQSDIDLSGRNITPIGNEVTPFYAHFSGDGHKISNLIIDQPDSDNVGLFGYVSGWLYDIITENGSITGRNNVGGIFGYASGTRGRCVNGNAVSGVRNVGGICGESQTPVIDGINIGTVTGTENVGAICGSENDNVKNCWYNSDTSGARGIAGADLEGAAKGLTTLQMTSADALTTMGLNSTLWTKKANDKAAGIAYYPSLREDGAPSIGYKSGVILENSSADSLVYLGTADFTVYSLVEFDGVPQAYSDTALTAGSGSFTVTLNDKEVAAAALPDGAKTKVTTSALPAAGDDCRFVLNYSGAGSSFIDDTSADCTVKVEKLALTASDLEFAPPSDLKYNGAPKEAEITVKPGISGAGDVTLKYYRDGNEADPVIPGTYTVTADIAEGDNCKAAVLSGGWEFTIVKGDITADLFTFTAPEDCRYNGKEKPVSVTVNDGAEGVGKIITLHYFSSTNVEIAVPVKPETIKVLIDVAEGEYYNAASNIGGWLYTIYYGTPWADDFIFHAPADTEYTGLPLAAAVEARRFSDGSETGMGDITAVKYYLDGVPTEPIAPGTYTVKIDVAKGECYLAASDVTSPDWTFTITPAALTASGSGTASGTFGGSLGSLSVSGLKVMLGTDEIPGRWALSGSNIPNVGDTGKYTAEFTADVHPEYYKPLTAKVTLDIAKAQAPAMADTTLSCYWGASGEKSVSLAGLPENTGEIYPATIAVSDVNGILAADSARYSDGKLYFTLGENTEESIGNTAEITVTLPTQNYTDFTFRITVTLAVKGDQQAPLQSDFRIELTSSGSDITAEIVTELSGVEFSFDGSDWGAENAAAVGHDEFVTGYIRFAETDILNPSPAASLTLRSGHGELTHHGRSEPNCISEGNTEYWECGLCARYFLDEAGTQETALKNVVLAKTGHTPGEAVRENEIPATCTADGSYDEVTYCTVCSEKYSTEHKTIPAAGHRWSVKYESDKSGHWHVCEVCDAASEAENHVSGGAATYAKPELCTVCGYEMSPRKTSTGGNSSGGTARPSRPAAATETQPGINGVQKSWADIAADLMKQGGGSAVISLNGETTVPADVIKAIADSRIKAEFIIDSIKSWIIDGAAIKSASAADFTVLPGNSDRSGLRGVFGADLKISGTGIPAELKLTFRREFAGQFANVYRLTDGGLEFRCCTRISVDGTAAIPGAYTGGEYVVMVCEYSDLPGDFSNDGIMNALDAAMILKDIVGFSRGENPRMADFNSDGVMNALDASAILRAIVAE